MPRLETFEDVLALLVGDVEVCRPSVADLEQRFGERYRRDALHAFRVLGRFARLQGDTLESTLRDYVCHLVELARERRTFMSSGEECGRREAEEDGFDPRTYLYALTLSTVLARGRYEIFRDYREVMPTHAGEGGPLLEVGAGNCQDAAFAASYGPVDAFDVNPLSRVWCHLLGLEGRVSLHTERYDFSDEAKYRFVTLIELLEHVPEPADLLHGVHRVLRPGGHAYLTFAVRMPQADHLYLFSSVEECRDLLADAGLVSVHEHCAVDTYMPYDPGEEWWLAAETNLPFTFCCLVREASVGSADQILNDFNSGFGA